MQYTFTYEIMYICDTCSYMFCEFQCNIKFG